MKDKLNAIKVAKQISIAFTIRMKQKQTEMVVIENRSNWFSPRVAGIFGLGLGGEIKLQNFIEISIIYITPIYLINLFYLT